MLTVQEDGMRAVDDPELLDRAAQLGRVLFTRDSDLLREAVRRQRGRETFAGVVYAHQLTVSIGQCVRDLELIAGICDLDEFTGRVEYLPLR